MDFQINPKNKSKHIAISVFIGIGKGIGAFLLTGIIGIILVLLSSLIWFESIPLMILGLTLLVGGVIAIIVGIRGGIKAYNNPQTTKSSDDLYKLFRDGEYIENFSKLTYRQRFVITEYGYLLSKENAEVVGKMLGNFQEKDVLPYCHANGKKVSGFEK